MRFIFFFLAAIAAHAASPHLYIWGDFLWWKADNSGYTYAFNQTTDSTTIPSAGKVLRIHSDWEPGFQIGIGCKEIQNGWDLLAHWTWYSNRSEESHTLSIPSSSLAQGFYPLWPTAINVSEGTDLGPYTTAQARWQLHLNSFDLKLCKSFLEIAHFALQLQWGARAAWLNQTFYNQFSNPIANALATASSPFTFIGKNNFWGIGPVATLQSLWHIGHGFSLLGNIGSSLLYGHTRVSHQSKDPAAIHHQFRYSFDPLAPTLQMLLGFEWMTHWQASGRFALRASWEVNCWWNQFNVPVSLESYSSPLPSATNAPLTTEGLTLNVQIDF